MITTTIDQQNAQHTERARICYRQHKCEQHPHTHTRINKTNSNHTISLLSSFIDNTENTFSMMVFRLSLLTIV